MTKRLHTICRAIFALWVISSLCFPIVASIWSIWEDVDATTIGRFAFYITVFTMVTWFVYGATGGSGVWKSVTNSIKPRPAKPLLAMFYDVEALHWKTLDRIEGWLWLLLGAWRKSDVEFFTRLSPAECIARLDSVTVNSSDAADMEEKPICGQLIGSHFYLFRVHGLLFNQQRSGILLFGKLTSTQQGTYVRAWYRFHWVTELFFYFFALFAIAFVATFMVTLGFVFLVPPLLLFIFLIGWIVAKIMFRILRALDPDLHDELINAFA